MGQTEVKVTIRASDDGDRWIELSDGKQVIDLNVDEAIELRAALYELYGI